MDLPDPFRFIVAVWFAIVGGAMGSLLNVIVYRVPAGLSIFWPGSHCPHCKHGIRPYDNVPVLAWLWLRGRCRDCGQPISARYPLVEAVTACLFLLLLDVEVFHEGTNLPLRIPVAVVHQSGYNEWQTFAICLLHLALLYTLLASALMTLDGNRPPWQLFVPAMVVGCVAPMFWPWLHPQASGRTLRTPVGEALSTACSDLPPAISWAAPRGGSGASFPPCGPAIRSGARPC